MYFGVVAGGIPTADEEQPHWVRLAHRSRYWPSQTSIRTHVVSLRVRSQLTTNATLHAARGADLKFDLKSDPAAELNLGNSLRPTRVPSLLITMSASGALNVHTAAQNSAFD